MFLKELKITNFKNIASLDVGFSKKINCLVGNNGMGKTNILDAIYALACTKSKFNTLENLNITFEQTFCMLKGIFQPPQQADSFAITYSLQHEKNDENDTPITSKRLFYNQTPYQRLADHIGKIPLVFLVPQDIALINDPEQRRRFMDSSIAQSDSTYLNALTNYANLIKQRNSLLKKMAENQAVSPELLEAIEQQIIPRANYICQQRKLWVESISPIFNRVYFFITNNQEIVQINYKSQLNEMPLEQIFEEQRQRDIFMGYTTCGVHRDDWEMALGGSSLKKIGSQGQQKTFIISLQLAQAFLLQQIVSDNLGVEQKPILLLDDIFDKLDNSRVKKIIELLLSENVGQVFITHTSSQLLDTFFTAQQADFFHVENGKILA